MFNEKTYYLTRSEYEQEIPCDTCGEIINFGERIELTSLGAHIHHHECYLKNVASARRG